eukprot:gene4615-838_t
MPPWLGPSSPRIIPHFVCQGGDVVKHDGTSGRSIYGDVMDGGCRTRFAWTRHPSRCPAGFTACSSRSIPGPSPVFKDGTTARRLPSDAGIRGLGNGIP